PPKLPADAPVALLGEPVEIAVLVALRKELHAPVFHRGHRLLGETRHVRAATVRERAGVRSLTVAARKVAHLYEPLVRQVRLDRRLAAVAVGHLDVAVLAPLEQAEPRHLRGHFLARLLAVH